MLTVGTASDAWPLAAQAVGDRCFQEGLFEPARAVFAHIPAWGRLASTLVRLHQFQAAVDAARKANSPKTWKEVRSRPYSYTFLMRQGCSDRTLSRLPLLAGLKLPDPQPSLGLEEGHEHAA